jgi:hypothetical protein
LAAASDFSWVEAIFIALFCIQSWVIGRTTPGGMARAEGWGGGGAGRLDAFDGGKVPVWVGGAMAIPGSGRCTAQPPAFMQQRHGNMSDWSSFHSIQCIAQKLEGSREVPLVEKKVGLEDEQAHSEEQVVEKDRKEGWKKSDWKD